MKNIIALIVLIFSVSAFSATINYGLDQNGHECSMTSLKQADDSLLVLVKADDLSTLFKLDPVSDTEYLYESFLDEEDGGKGISLYVDLDPENFGYTYYSKFETEKTVQCKLK